MTNTSRRTMLKGLSATAAAAFIPLGTMTPAQASKIEAPAAPTLPGGIKTYVRAYQNSAGNIQVDALWTATPKNAEEVAALANWAKAQGWTLRPRGYAHAHAPITISGAEENYAKVLLLDLRNGLTRLDVTTGPKPSVTVGAGVTQEELLNALSSRGLGLTSHSARGEITVGGMLAVADHGTGIPVKGQTTPEGRSYGSVANLVLEVEAVVYDSGLAKYVVKRYRRDRQKCGAILSNLGRVCITEAKLMVAQEENVRCQSRMDIELSELMAAPGSTGKTAMSFIDKTGRIEITHYPYTRHSWLKVWTSSHLKPHESKEVTAPYNFPFADEPSSGITNLARSVANGAVGLTPLLGSVQWSHTSYGLRNNKVSDIWGSAKDVMLYTRPSTLRMDSSGHSVLCQRKDIQRVLHEFYTKFNELTTKYRRKYLFPASGPLNIRVTGVDSAQDTGVAGGSQVNLSPCRPVEAAPQWDCVVHFEVQSIPGTRGANDFYTELETWIFDHYKGSYARARVAWPCGWGYTAEGPWKSRSILQAKLPASLVQGDSLPNGFYGGTNAYLDMDRARVFTSKLHLEMFPGFKINFLPSY